MENNENAVNGRDVELFIMQKGKYFPDFQLMQVKKQLSELSSDQFLMVSSMEYKDPMVVFLISLFLGELGVDRFMLGQTGTGVGKLITTCLCGVGLIWWLIDLFKISNDTKEYNFQKLQQMIVINR